MTWQPWGSSVIIGKGGKGKMKILAVDPGPKYSGVIVLDGEEVRPYGLYPNNELLTYFKHSSHDFDVVVIEKIILYKRVGSEVGDTIFFSGKLYEASKARRTELIPRVTIRNYFCGRWKANDAGIKKALIERFGKLKLSPHEWQALGLAVYIRDRK